MRKWGYNPRFGFTFYSGQQGPLFWRLTFATLLNRRSFESISDSWVRIENVATLTDGELAMKRLKWIAAIAIAMCSFSASADQFNFSYTFGSGDIATGSFFGTQNGLYVENISNITASLDGVSLPGTPYLNGFFYAAGCCVVDLPPVVSFDGNLNSFFFAVEGIEGNPFWLGGFFAILGVNGPWQSAAFSLGSVSTYVSDVSFNGVPYIGEGIQGGFDASHWTLTPVPEPETYAMLLAGLGLLGIVGRRRKQKQAVAA